MLPVIELRGAIPVGVAMGLDPSVSTIISLVGNLLPVPFIILFIRRIFTWMKHKSRRLADIAERLEKKAQSKGSMLYKGELIGLAIFVAIPLPGTGAWTGALIAAILGMRLKAALPAIAAGVFVAGLIIFGITYGFKAVL
ncbi:MAG: small multi-drug export protein [Clostridiales bacterium]|nr:small multi-drug export protein [Clostridiales bacterium]